MFNSSKKIIKNMKIDQHKILYHNKIQRGILKVNKRSYVLYIDMTSVKIVHAIQ